MYRKLYERVREYLPTLPPYDEVEFRVNKKLRVGILGRVLRNKKIVEFSKEKPSKEVYIHELVHLSGIHNESHTELLTLILRLALLLNLPKTNIHKILKINMNDLDRIVKKLCEKFNIKVKSVREFLEFTGVSYYNLEKLREFERVEVILTDICVGILMRDTFSYLYIEFLKELFKTIKSINL